VAINATIDARRERGEFSPLDLAVSLARIPSLTCVSACSHTETGRLCRRADN
jgi:hypothetical protein